jgi:hypothetical protein
MLGVNDGSFAFTGGLSAANQAHSVNSNGGSAGVPIYYFPIRSGAYGGESDRRFDLADRYAARLK